MLRSLWEQQSLLAAGEKQPQNTTGLRNSVQFQLPMLAIETLIKSRRYFRKEQSINNLCRSLILSIFPSMSKPITFASDIQ